MAGTSLQQAGINSKAHGAHKRVKERNTSVHAELEPQHGTAVSVPTATKEPACTKGKPRKRRGGKENDVVAKRDTPDVAVQKSKKRAKVQQQALETEQDAASCPGPFRAMVESGTCSDTRQNAKVGLSQEQGLQRETGTEPCKECKRKPSRFQGMKSRPPEIIPLQPDNAGSSGQAEPSQEVMKGPNDSGPVQPGNLGMPEISWRATLDTSRKRMGRYGDAERTTILETLKVQHNNAAWWYCNWLYSGLYHSTGCSRG